MSDTAVRFEAVTRRFGRKVALDGLDLAVPAGEVVGLVGRNAAGKTTALRLAHGLLHPDAGTIRVLGLDPVADGAEVRSRVGFLSEESALYGWMRVEEILAFAAKLHPGWDSQLAGELVERLELEPGARIDTLSRGSKAKVSLALTAATRPDLLFLDDPTAGLDPLVRREVLAGVLESVSERGGAVLYASHLIQDLERVADRVVVLDAGRVVIGDSLEGLKARVLRARAVFPEGAPDVAAQIAGRLDSSVDGRLLSVVVDGAEGPLAATLRELGASQVEIDPLSLEEILVACLRRSGRKEVARV